jgi:alkaline phosphatase D
VRIRHTGKQLFVVQVKIFKADFQFVPGCNGSVTVFCLVFRIFITLKLKMMKKIFVCFLSITMFQIYAQKSLINTGPMVGHTGMTETYLWIQTKKPAKVKFAYFPEGEPGRKKFTKTYKTFKDNGYTLKVKLTDLKRGTKYRYEVYVNGKKQKFDYPLEFETQDVWRYRKPPRDFSFVFGSGAYINDEPWDRKGRPYGGEYEIYKSIWKTDPDFMIWGGDNVYLRQGEWNSKERTIYRFSKDRSLPEMQPLLASVAHYAIVDDHDIGPNDCDGHFWNKEATWQVFDDFWANPPKAKGMKGAVTQFSWYDADFFLLDNRYYRDANHLKTKSGKTILGKEQLEWLKNALASSKARFKFIVMGGQFLNSARRFETYSNYGFAKERLEILDFIYDQGLENVIFLTGDRHMSEISMYDPSNGNPVIYDLTCSPFTSGPNTHAWKEINVFRIPGSLIMQRNFAKVEIKGQGKERHVEVTYYDKDGRVIYSYKLDFKHPERKIERKEKKKK